MPLCTQLQVEQTLQISFQDDPEPVITELIARASKTINTWLKREIEEATYTNELYDLDGQQEIRLRNWPVSAVAAVVENGTALVVDDQYVWYEDGRLARVSGQLQSRFGWGRKALDVTYTAGYTTVPEDISGVCARMVSRWFQAGAAFANSPDVAVAVTEVSLEGSDSIKYAEAAQNVTSAQIMTMDEAEVLGSYRRWL